MKEVTIHLYQNPDKKKNDSRPDWTVHVFKDGKWIEQGGAWKNKTKRGAPFIKIKI